MKHYIQILVSLSMYTFILSSLFGAGLGLTVKEIIDPLRKIRLVVLALLANFVLIPILAYMLCVWLKADASMQAGLMLLACCAGAPFLPKLVSLAKGSLAHSIGLMVLLMVVTVGFAPIILTMVIPGLSVDPMAIAKPLIILMLLPLGLGLLIKAIRPEIAVKIGPIVILISNISLLAWLVFALSIDYKLIISAYGTGIYNLTFWFAFGALLIGYIFSSLDRSERVVMTLGAGARNIAAALIIAVANFTEPKVVTVVMIGSLVQFILLFIISRAFGKAKLPGQAIN